MHGNAAGGSLGSLSRKELDALIAEAKKVAKRSVTLLPLAAERAGEWRRTAASDKLGPGPFVHARTRNYLVYACRCVCAYAAAPACMRQGVPGFRGRYTA